jgi:hypothetical protein
MKQFLFSIALLAALQMTAFSQSTYSTYNGKKWEQLSGSGKLVSLNPAIEAFSTLELSNINVKVVVQTGAAAYSMSVVADDNLAQFFKWKQQDGTLKLYMDFSGGKYDRWLSSNNIVVTIQAPAFNSLVNTGNGNIEVQLQEQPLFNITSTGNADMAITGKVNQLQLTTAGNANIKAGGLLAEKVTLSTNGNADIEVNTKELVEAAVNGNNEITNIFNGAKKEAATDTNPKPAAELIAFKLKNNRLLPAKVTVIWYQPGETGNGTTAFILLPGGSRIYRFAEGTKIYLASQQQVNTVMSGASLIAETPFLVVKKEDAGKTFKIK